MVLAGHQPQMAEALEATRVSMLHLWPVTGHRFLTTNRLTVQVKKWLMIMVVLEPMYPWSYHVNPSHIVFRWCHLISLMTRWRVIHSPQLDDASVDQLTADRNIQLGEGIDANGIIGWSADQPLGWVNWACSTKVDDLVHHFFIAGIVWSWPSWPPSRFVCHHWRSVSCRSSQVRS